MSLKTSSCILFCFLLFIKIRAQTTTSFTIQDKSINQVSFSAEQVSVINFTTHSESSISFASASESTYKNELYFDYKVEGSVLFIKSVFPARLAFGDNKMTSMQEFSVSVNMVLPEDLKLDIRSDMASVEGQGVFKSLTINTKSGYCRLKSFLGNANINTYDGLINLTTRQAKIKAQSQTGNVNIDESLVQNYFINLRSVNGDIKVIQME